MTRFLFLITLAIVYIPALGKGRNLNCRNAKTGVFYFYDSIAKRSLMIIRDKGIQKEIVDGTNDTTFYRVMWTSDCSFMTKFIRSTASLKPEDEAFMKKYDVTYDILHATKEYYVFKGRTTFPKTNVEIVDTVWIGRRK